ncbi:MAG: hypothetical protein M3313_03665 [Actinomycetota bacterium]|nr:hypothetical protein [Actinomycetota bacterium]
MAGLLVVFFPLLLLAFLLFMERVEEPLRREPTEVDVAEFLDTARRQDVDNVFRYGVRRSLQRWRSRRRLRPKLAALRTRPRDQ